MFWLLIFQRMQYVSICCSHFSLFCFKLYLYIDDEFQFAWCIFRWAQSFESVGHCIRAYIPKRCGQFSIKMFITSWMNCVMNSNEKMLLIIYWRRRESKSSGFVVKRFGPFLFRNWGGDEFEESETGDKHIVDKGLAKSGDYFCVNEYLFCVVYELFSLPSTISVNTFYCQLLLFQR